MPELPEVETVCRLIKSCLGGHRIESVEAFKDEIVFRGVASDEIEGQLLNKTVGEVGRKGKYFWIDFGEDAFLIGHLGMSGWITRLERDEETPKFAKLRLDSTSGCSIVITDARRLGRIWISSDPRQDKTIKALGLDAYSELPAKSRFHELIVARKAPIKAVLLDQSLLSGIGNYLADEVLYQARVAPNREAKSLNAKETSKLHSAILDVIGVAVDVGADEDRFPDTWLFHHRWGGKRGAEKIGKHQIVRETIGGRTTAWVPSVQK